MIDPSPARAYRSASGLRRAWRRLLLDRAVVVLVSGLVLTAIATFVSTRVLQEREMARAELAMDQDLSRLDSRLSAYLALLRATRAFIEAEGPSLDADGFSTFVQGLRINQDYPGIQGIGWSPKLGPGDRFEIRLLEPLDERNRAALGFDMHSEATRAAAMDRARDTGEPAMSGGVVLRQEILPEKSRGFLIYVPVYAGGGVPPTVPERRAQLSGFAYAPFRAVDFFSGLFSDTPIALHSIHVTGQPDDGLLWGHAEATTRPVFERFAEHAGQRWLLRFERIESGLSMLERIRPFVVLVVCLVITALLFTLARVQVSERRRAERRNAELGQQVQFAELLIGIVSHDLRNPLNVIKLNATLLENASLSEEFGRCVRRIQASGDMSLRMVRDLLDFTQARFSGGIPVLRTPGDLIQIVHQTVDEIQLAHRDRQIVFSARGDASGTWDPDRMAQLVSNLLNNALVYGATDAPITVAVHAEGQRIRLRVHNEGEPISPQLQAALFQPMQQGPSRKGSSARNIGLGLYIVQQIVQAHGGTVECLSSAAEGTAFTVTLPRA
ncbi:CHASE domain-containing protein [Ramlibacter sp. AW1]|uniref:histidine kinase n=1 Tax=Ramlibacter aurantiacus TaxID=2801330 RepID=A0A936ZNC4_9BURK|nr:CHASE domain-containing protein [Ramlibacter aurantiacus]MBL0419396.1 CHASE domain-containing protein [Ramlibacter aurantiacus]